MGRGEAMARGAAPEAGIGAGHCLSSSAVNAAGVSYPRAECGRLLVVVLGTGSDRETRMINAHKQGLVEQRILMRPLNGSA